MKKNLLLLHGALGSAVEFDSLISLLEPQFNCHRFDFEGHGVKSASPQDYKIETFALNIIEYIAENELGPIVVFGFSMGGYAALYAATLQPGLFKGVITLGTKFKWTSDYAHKEVRFLNPDLILQKVPGFAQELENRHGSQWKTVLYKTAQMMLQLGHTPVLTSELLTTLKIPVTIGMGDRDNTLTFEETIEISRSLQNVALYVLPSTPHPFDKVNQLLLSQLILNQSII